MRKDARLSDQVTAGTGSRVAEGCLKTGSPASRSRAGFIELRFLAHFSIKETLVVISISWATIKREWARA
jgi:hypothetical protein